MNRAVEAVGGWFAAAESWWPVTLAAIMVVLMTAALVGIVVRCFRMLRGEPGGFAAEAAGVEAGAKIGWRALSGVAAIVLGARLVLYLWAWVVYCLYAHTWSAPWETFRYLWAQWDGHHYLKLAEQWYTAPGVAGPADHLMLVFFPMFPLVLSGLRVLFGGNTLIAAVVLNAACSMGAGCILFCMTARVYGKQRAWLALGYLLVNPFSLFLGAPYPEALFLVLTLAAMEAANRRKYLVAGVFGALSAYTRMLGLIVLGVILLEGAQHWLEHRALRKPRVRLSLLAAGGAAVVGLGFAAYLALNVSVSGAPFTFLEYQWTNWHQKFGSFWNTARVTGESMLREPFMSDSFLGTWLPQCVSMVFVAALLAVRQRKLPLAWAAYAWVYLFIALAPTWLLSGPRYLMVLAVLPVLQSLITTRKWFHVTFLALQAALLFTYTYLYAVVRNVL